MSSYDPPADVTGIITEGEMRRSMQLVRLQIATPLSLLMTIGANLVCALAIRPGLADINKMYPTLLSPNPIMIGIFWILLYSLQIGLCLILVLARKDETKATLVHGVGLRFAIANWLQAGWAVAWTLKWFKVSEIIILLNVINLASTQITLLSHRQSKRRPLDSIFIHAPMTMFFVILFGIDWLHNGFIALNWLSLMDQSNPYQHWWKAVLALFGVNLLLAVWIVVRLDVYACLAAEWILLSVLLSRQTKPTAETVTIVILLVVHPVALIGALAWAKTKEREGRIRLEEEAEGGGALIEGRE
ncbi:hypothetical protein NliqN6_6813 [Naganishia liquefaciens]|uniref:Tryptophan-rich sensory protein n=1 Tax=Naganishia liquefaciens TaxID=104408 RepID=A0A8H3U0K9_9TREE|nr:hypothetical protein NliqN6_6813 [Naganishia liquefaciens]